MWIGEGKDSEYFLSCQLSRSSLEPMVYLGPKHGNVPIRAPERTWTLCSREVRIGLVIIPLLWRKWLFSTILDSHSYENGSFANLTAKANTTDWQWMNFSFLIVEIAIVPIIDVGLERRWIEYKSVGVGTNFLPVALDHSSAAFYLVIRFFLLLLFISTPRPFHPTRDVFYFSLYYPLYPVPMAESDLSSTAVLDIRDLSF